MENKFTDYYRMGGIGGIKLGRENFQHMREIPWDIQRSLCIHKDKKIIYYKPGKCAGTSMYKGILRPMGGWVNQLDDGVHFSGWMDKITDNEWEQYFSFIFVRNPFDRLLSCWKTTHRHMSFKDYVKSGMFVDGVPKVLHYQTQCSLLEVSDLSCKTKLNFIGKVENIKEDWKKLCSLIDIPHVTMPHLKSNGKFPHYREFYDVETKELVENMYKRDLELFDYEF